MQTKLTLRVDDRLVRQAKAYAHRRGKSVSGIVADYFARLGGKAAPADGLVTRDPAGFKSSRLRVYAPDELLNLLAAAPPDRENGEP